MVGAMLGRSCSQHQIVRGIDQADVRQSLRKITHLTPVSPIVFLREQPYVILQSQKRLEQFPRLIIATQYGEIVSEPETARQERPFTGRQAVNTRLCGIALNETILHQLTLDCADGAANPRVVGRQKPDQRNHQQGRVERSRIVVLDKTVALAVE